MSDFDDEPPPLIEHDEDNIDENDVSFFLRYQTKISWNCNEVCFLTYNPPQFHDIFRLRAVASSLISPNILSLSCCLQFRAKSTFCNLEQSNLYLGNFLAVLG